MGWWRSTVIGILVSTATAACTYPGVPNLAETTFKCDPQNLCPDGYYCKTTPGVCVQTLGCAGQPTSYFWEFPMDMESWAFDPGPSISSTAVISWIGDQGDPDVGAIGTQIPDTLTTSQILGWFAPPPGLGDMRGAIVSGRVWTDSPGITAKPHATNAAGGWIDGGDVHLVPNTWTCVSFAIDHPAQPDPTFDPTNVYYVGFQLDGTAPLRVLIDDVGY